MKTSIVYREYVRNSAMVDEAMAAAQGLDYLKVAGYKCGIAGDWNPASVSVNRMDTLKKYLDGKGIPYSFPDGQRSGAGGNIYKGLFEMFGTDFRIVADIGDFDASAPDFLEPAEYMTEMLLDRDSPVGVVSKNRLLLSDDPELQKIREIHEVFLMSFIKNAEFHNPLEASNYLPGSYKRGYLFTGSYVANARSSRFDEFRARIENARRAADMKTFAFEYYMIMMASQFGAIPSVLAPVKPGVTATPRSRDQVEKIMRYDSEQILKTDIGQGFMRHMENPSTEKFLKSFYDPAMVDYVKELMLHP